MLFDPIGNDGKIGLTPFQKFAKIESFSGILLFGVTLVVMIGTKMANMRVDDRILVTDLIFIIFLPDTVR